MKRTVISYKKLDQHKVEIIGFKNAATRNDIKAELGLQGANEYLNDGLNYYLWGQGIVIKRDDERRLSGHVGTISPGVIFTNSKFLHLVKKMKQGGNRFAELKAQRQRVHEIKI